MTAMKPIIETRNEAFYMQIGLNVKRAREARKLTQQQLGDRVNLSRTSVTNLERGRQKILVHTLADLAAALKTSVSELIPSSSNEPAIEHSFSHLAEPAESFIKSFFPQIKKTRILKYDGKKKAHQ